MTEAKMAPNYQAIKMHDVEAGDLIVMEKYPKFFLAVLWDESVCLLSLSGQFQLSGTGGIKDSLVFRLDDEWRFTSAKVCPCPQSISPNPRELPPGTLGIIEAGPIITGILPVGLQNEATILIDTGMVEVDPKGPAADFSREWKIESRAKGDSTWTTILKNKPE